MAERVVLVGYGEEQAAHLQRGLNAQIAGRDIQVRHGGEPTADVAALARDNPDLVVIRAHEPPFSGLRMAEALRGAGYQ